MAREKYKMGSRSSRFGPKRSSRLSKGARTTVPLNRGSSPHKQSTTLALNTPGGGFGSGRAHGGGGGLGPNLAAALMGTNPSVEGDPVVGPPPVDPGPPVTNPVSHPVPIPPSLTPPPPPYSNPFPPSNPNPVHPVPIPPSLLPPPPPMVPRTQRLVPWAS